MTRDRKAILKAVLLMLFVAVNICRSFLWVMPSSLMVPIMKEVGLDYIQAGLLVLTVTALMGVFMIVGSFIMGRLEPANGMVFGMLCIALDGVFSYMGKSFTFLLIGKVFCGIGYGLTTCAATALIASLFYREQLGFINGLNMCIGNLSISMAYRFIVPIYNGLGSWRQEAIVWSICSVATLFLFLVWSKSMKGERTASISCKKDNNLKKALSLWTVRCLILAVGSIMLIYVSMTSYYPSYLHTVQGFSLNTASSMAGVLSVSGMISCLVVGVSVNRIRNQKAFIIIVICLAFFGFGGMCILHSYIPLMCAIACFGAGYMALATFSTSMIMRLPGIEPLTASAGVSLMNACGSLLAITIPFVQETVSEHAGLQMSFLLFGILFIPSFLGTLLLRESTCIDSEYKGEL